MTTKSPNHLATLEEFRKGRKPATPRERAAGLRMAASTLRIVKPPIEDVAAMLESWAEVQETIAVFEDEAARRPLHLSWNGTEWVDDRCGCRYHPDDDNGSHGGAPHVHRCERHQAQPAIPTSVLLRRLRQWRDGSTAFTDTMFTVEVGDASFSRGDLPSAVAAMLGLIETGDTL